MRRLDAWRALKQSEFPESPMMCDLDHWPNSKGCTHGPDWPVQLTRGTVAALGLDPADQSSWRIATAKEHLGAQGFALHPGHCDLFGVMQIASILEGFTPRQLKLLSGNGMHLVTQASFMCYILANTVRILVVNLGRQLGECTSNDIDFDDGSTWKRKTSLA